MRGADTALLALIAGLLVILLWRDINRPVLTAGDIAFALSSSGLCVNPAVKPAPLEP